jgi:hypothetical protein
MPPKRQLGGKFSFADLDPIHDLMGLGKQQTGGNFMGLPIAAPLGLSMLFGNGNKRQLGGDIGIEALFHGLKKQWDQTPLKAMRGGMMLGAALARNGNFGELLQAKAPKKKKHSGNSSALQEYQKRLKKLKREYPDKSHKALVQMAKR